jgi:hypothetical protein
MLQFFDRFYDTKLSLPSQILGRFRTNFGPISVPFTANFWANFKLIWGSILGQILRLTGADFWPTLGQFRTNFGPILLQQPHSCYRSTSPEGRLNRAVFYPLEHPTMISYCGLKC